LESGDSLVLRRVLKISSRAILQKSVQISKCIVCNKNSKPWLLTLVNVIRRLYERFSLEKKAIKSARTGEHDGLDDRPRPEHRWNHGERNDA
jgi:hypothetical protein